MQKTLFWDFLMAFDSIPRRKKEHILLAYSFLNETVSGIKILYNYMKATVCLADNDTDYFDIVYRLLQWDT